MAPVRFTGVWTLPASPARVREVIIDLEHWVEWWPQVHAVAALGPDDARVLARSTLPHTLDLVVHAVCRDLPVLEVHLGGDLEGRATWQLTEHRGQSLLRYDQQVSARGGLGLATRLVRPVVRWNHDRMMAGCIAGLRTRLAAG